MQNKFYQMVIKNKDYKMVIQKKLQPGNTK